MSAHDFDFAGNLNSAKICQLNASIKPPLYRTNSTSTSGQPTSQDAGSRSTSGTGPTSDRTSSSLAMTDTLDLPSISRFSAPDADLIIKTSDGTTFRVFARIVSEASPVLMDRLTTSLGPPGALREYRKPISKEMSPVMDVTEDADTMEALLKFIYPTPDPQVYSLDFLANLIAAAEKYSMSGAISSLRAILLTFIPQSPIRVYAISCVHHYDEEAKAASRGTLGVDIVNTKLFDELEHISAREFVRLLQLHQTRAANAMDILNLVSCSCNGCGTPAIWFTEWRGRAQEEIRSRPTSEISFGLSFFARGVAEAAKQCGSCPLSYVSSASQARLHSIKERIDELPDTI